MAYRTVCDQCDKTIKMADVIELSKTSTVTGGKHAIHFCSWECVEKHSKAKKKELK